MDYYGDNDWRDYHLAHYGKKGMKWGKKKNGDEVALARHQHALGVNREALKKGRAAARASARSNSELSKRIQYDYGFTKKGVKDSMNFVNLYRKRAKKKRANEAYTDFVNRNNSNSKRTNISANHRGGTIGQLRRGRVPKY